MLQGVSLLSDKSNLLIKAFQSMFIYTVVALNKYTLSREERRFLNFNHLTKEFLEQMIPHLKAHRAWT